VSNEKVILPGASGNIAKHVICGGENDAPHPGFIVTVVIIFYL